MTKSARVWVLCTFAALASSHVRADDIRWRHVATRGSSLDAGVAVRTFLKPASSSTPVAHRSDGQESAPPRTDTTNRTVKPNLTAVIRNDAKVATGPNRESLERAIGVECSRHTREYSVRGDPDGRIVVVVCLRSVVEWNALVARIRALPDLGAHAVIVRGSVP